MVYLWPYDYERTRKVTDKIKKHTLEPQSIVVPIGDPVILKFVISL